MSNLAREFQQQQQVERTIQERSIVKTKKQWLTPGEKIIGLVFTGFVCLWCCPAYLESSRNLPGK